MLCYVVRSDSCNKITRNKKGFTLVELIVVIAVIGILAAVCLPALTGQIRGGQVRADNATAQLLTNACKRAAMENSLNAGRAEYQKIVYLYDATGNTLDVLTLADISLASATPKNPGGFFIYNPLTKEMRLLKAGEDMPGDDDDGDGNPDFVKFINDKGEVFEKLF